MDESLTHKQTSGNELKKMLENEAGAEMSDELFLRFFGAMTEIRLKNRQVLVNAGQIDTNMYVIESGIIRACYFDGPNEKTYGFADAGSVLFAYHSLRMGKPAFFQYESCGESSVLKISKKDLDQLVRSSHEFATWMLASQYTQLFFNELKHAVIMGSIKERYVALLKNRPEILVAVPSKIIASYLGVTPSHLSYLKRTLR